MAFSTASLIAIDAAIFSVGYPAAAAMELMAESAALSPPEGRKRAAARLSAFP